MSGENGSEFFFRLYRTRVAFELRDLVEVEPDCPLCSLNLKDCLAKILVARAAARTLVICAATAFPFDIDTQTYLGDSGSYTASFGGVWVRIPSGPKYVFHSLPLDTRGIAGRCADYHERKFSLPIPFQNPGIICVHIAVKVRSIMHAQGT